MAVHIKDGRHTFTVVGTLAVPRVMSGVKSAGALVIRPRSALTTRSARRRGVSTTMFSSVVEVDINVRSVRSLGRSFATTVRGATKWAGGGARNLGREMVTISCTALGGNKFVHRGRGGGFSLQLTIMNKGLATRGLRVVTGITRGCKSKRMRLASHRDIRVPFVGLSSMRRIGRILTAKKYGPNIYKPHIHAVATYRKSTMYPDKGVSDCSVTGGLSRHCFTERLPRGFGFNMAKYRGGYLGTRRGSIKVGNTSVIR